MVDWVVDETTGVKTTKVEGLSQLVSTVAALQSPDGWGLTRDAWGGEKFFRNGVWFRGQRVRIMPEPAIVWKRPRDEPERPFDEVTLYTDFQLRLAGRPGMPTEKDALPWLALMRHHDLPNRVLDWSTSLAVALRFALRASEANSEPHVWVLNARALNEVTANPTYLQTPLTRESKVAHPWVWQHGSFDAALRAEQGQARWMGQVVRLLDAHHYTSKGYPGRQNLVELESWLRDCWGEAYNDWPNYLQELASDGDRGGDGFATLAWRLSTPAAVHPPWNNDRIVAQKGVLTAHGGLLTGKPCPRRDGVSSVPLPPAVNLATVVKRCAAPGLILRRIDLLDLKGLRNDLGTLGLEYQDLMPEVEHQVDAILERHDGFQER